MDSPFRWMARAFPRLDRIEPPGKKPRARFVVATDVGNPLFGAKGAAYQFAPQKGADAATVRRLDAGYDGWPAS